MIDYNNRTMLVDGDIIAFMSSVQMEEPIKWDDDTWTLHASESKSIDKLCDTIEYYRQILFCKNVVIALSSKTNFRKKIYSLYKFNRKGMRKPLTYLPCLDYMRENFNTYEMPYLEGDDVLGILATSDMIEGEKVILTKDKDLKTIPSTIWFMQGDDYTEVSEDEANLNHMIQALQGDATDGISGCPSIGIKTATRLLEPVKDSPKKMWEVVLNQYKKQNLDSKYALLMARLTRICRASDYNFERKRPILWKPTTI